MKWIDKGTYHWAEWTNDDEDYDYFVRVACENDNGNSRNPCFLVSNSLPNVNAPSGASELVVINGSIFKTDTGSYGVGYLAYNNGGNVTTYSYQAKQYNFGTSPSSSDYLSMYSEGNANFNFAETGADGSRNVEAGWYPVTLGCNVRSNGTGADGTYATSSHSFIGRNGNYNYAGYCTGVSGSTAVSYMTGYYGGGTCAILDGGGSTYCRYQGTTKCSSSRAIHNAIAVYYKKKEQPTPTTQYTVSVNASPANGGTVTGGGTYDSGTSVTLTATANDGYAFTKWSDGSTSESLTITVSSNVSYTAYFNSIGITDSRKISPYAIGRTFVYTNGSLKLADPWYRLHNNALQGRPDAIYQLQNGSLQPLIFKNYINFTINGGNAISPLDFYTLTESISSLPTPTHSDYDSRAVTFDGWYYDNTFATKVLGVSSEAAGSRSYCAKWVQTKTQYSGNYEIKSTYTLPSETISTSGTVYYNKYIQPDDGTLTVTSLYMDVDSYYSDYTGYTKCRVDYGYAIVGSGTATVLGTLYSQGEIPTVKSVNYTVPSNGLIMFKIYPAYSTSNAKCTLNTANATVLNTKTADWQDSSSPPSGSWASGYPITRELTRYYDGSSWTDWE